MKHEGHRITYNENATCEYEITSIDPGTNTVAFDLSTQQIADLVERFLFCEDCNERLDPEQFELQDTWTAYPNGEDSDSMNDLGISESSIVNSPSGWTYRSDQENGDNVDCRECGNPLDDDFPIANDDNGYAYHAECFQEPKPTV